MTTHFPTTSTRGVEHVSLAGAIAKFAISLQEEDIAERLNLWLTTLDRGEDVLLEVGREQGFNAMHVCGMCFASDLHNLKMNSYNNYSIEDSVYKHCVRMRVTNTPLQEMTWQELVDFSSSLQLEFSNIITRVKTRDRVSYHSKVDVGELIVMMLCRFGFFVRNEWPAAMANIEYMQSVQCDDYTVAQVASQHIAQFLDVIHSTASVAMMILWSVNVSGEDSLEDSKVLEISKDLSEHHREVSLDNFYEMSMVSDLRLASIVQYKHRHQEVFHSISQVVYFNWPAYARRKQKKFDEIVAAPSDVHLLPLLHEMYPEIPILYEHTGALNQQAHAKHKLAWVCWSEYIFLVSDTLSIFCGDNLIHVLAYGITHTANINPPTTS